MKKRITKILVAITASLLIFTSGVYAGTAIVENTTFFNIHDNPELLEVAE